MTNLIITDLLYVENFHVEDILSADQITEWKNEDGTAADLVKLYFDTCDPDRRCVADFGEFDYYDVNHTIATDYEVFEIDEDEIITDIGYVNVIRKTQ